MKPKSLLEMWDEGQNESRFQRYVCSKQYVTLEENESQEKAKEEKAKKKKKYKKYKKNVRKVLHYSWKCLLLGLQNFTVGYYAPTVPAAFISEFRSSSDKTRPNHL